MSFTSRLPRSGWPHMARRWRRALVGLHSVVALALLLALLPQPQAAMAAGITVTTTADTIDASGGDCSTITLGNLPGPDALVSLREAICAANSVAGADTITFATNGTFQITQAGEDDANALGDFDITSDVTITGNGAANTIIDGMNADRVLDIFPFGCSGCTVSISGVTITRGKAYSGNSNIGGGVAIGGGATVTISNSTIQNSTSAESGGGGGINNNGGILTLNTVAVTGNSTVVQGGGLRNSGVLTIINSTFSNNTADEGAGLWTSTFGGSNVSITGSTFQGNTTIGVAGGTSGDGAGLFIGGDSSVSLSSSTVNGNTAQRNGGGVYLRDDPAGTVAALMLTNNTISGNAARGAGGGLYHESGGNVVNNTTITLNTSNSDSSGGGDGGGIYAAASTLTVRNSIVAGNNVNAGARPDCGGTFTTGGYNLFGDNTQCPASTGDANLVTLGKTISQVLNTTLALNGGTTLNHALVNGSPAVDTANNATCASTDQRGQMRPSGAACDKGSYELVDTTPPDTTITSQPPALSNSGSATFSFTGSDNVTPPSSLTFQCKLDSGAFTTCTSPQNYTGLTDGTHIFQVRAVDTAGNVDGTPATATWTIDATPPAAPVIITPANGSLTSNPLPVVSGTAEPGSTVTIVIDGTSVGAVTADASGNWTFTPSTPLGQGAHTVKARAADTAGNSSPDSNTNTFTVDTIEPGTTFTSTPPAATNSTSASFQFSATDSTGINRYECSLDGATFSTCTSPQNLTSLTEGSHTFRVRAVDNAGNTETTPASFTWTVDIGAPDTGIATMPVQNSNSANATFTFTGTDATTPAANLTFECSLDGAAFAACSSPANYTNLADGSHAFEVRAIDEAGNVDATPARYTWTVDTAAPDTTITSTPPSLSNSQNASFSFTSSDGSGSGVTSLECSLDGAAFAACSSPANYTNLADGIHAFAVRAVDAAGNIDSTPASYTWTVEAAPPDTAITSAPAANSNSASASFSFTGSDNATPAASLTFECALDGSAFAACTSPANYTGLADGSHTFAVRAIDEASNVDATPASFTWTVDTAAPDTTILSMPVTNTNSVTATLTFTGTDATTPAANLTFECSLDGAAFTKCTSPADYTGLADGSHTFAVRAIDEAGNVDATPASFTWTIDTAPVTVTINQAASQADPATTAPISFTVEFNKPVTGFGDSPSDIDLSGGTAPGTLSAAVSGGPGVYTVMVSGMTGAGTVQARVPASAVTDASGNSNSASASTDNVVTFTPTAPIVTGIMRMDASPTNAATLQFRVTFSEPVTGVAAKGFQLVMSGVSGATITSVSGSGNTWIVAVNAGSNDGTLGLNLVDNDTITGVSSGIVLGGTGTGNGDFAGEAYQIDRAPPTATLGTVSPAVRGASVLTFTVTFSDNLAVNAASLAGAINVMGPNGYSQQATLLSTTPTTNGTPLRARYQLSAPGGTWDGADNGTYTITVIAGQTRDTAGNELGASTLGTFDVIFAGSSVYLPLVAAVPATPGLPDLVVDRITLTSNGLAVVIRNQGETPADPFWVDLYINPTTAPTRVGQTWQMLGSQGMAWGVTASEMPLAPGATLTLTVGDAFFHAELSQYPARRAAGTPIFVQVDSASSPTGYGAILETHEYSGEPYNNISSATVPDGGVPLPIQAGAEQTRTNMDLPRRPKP